MDHRMLADKFKDLVIVNATVYNDRIHAGLLFVNSLPKGCYTISGDDMDYKVILPIPIRLGVKCNAELERIPHANPLL